MDKSYDYSAWHSAVRAPKPSVTVDPPKNDSKPVFTPAEWLAAFNPPKPSVTVDPPKNDPKAAFGNAKPSVSCIPPVAIFAMGQAMQSGADKYGAFNWRSTTVNASVYYNAVQRHLMAWWDGQESDPDTAASHLGHAMAGMALILDGQSLGVLNDDRPVKGGLPGFLKDNTKHKDAT